MMRGHVMSRPVAGGLPKGLAVAAGALLAGLTLSGCGKAKEAGPAPGGAPEVAVVVAQSERIAISTELPARVSAFLVAEVRPQVSGIIRERLFKEGSDVKAGDVLYGIAPDTYQAAHASAKAAVAVAKANHATSVAAVAAAKAALANAQAARDAVLAALVSAKAGQSRAESNAVPLRLRAERFAELVTSKAVSQQDCDDASAALKQAEAGITSAQAAVQGAEADVVRAAAAIQSTAAEVQRAEAAVQGALAAIASAEAGLETARINLEYTRVTAPISGRIGKSAVTIGALATAHQAVPLATVQQLDPVYVDAPQSSADLLRLKQALASGGLKRAGGGEAKVTLLLEDGTPYPLPGTLEFSDVTVDPSTGSFNLRMVFKNPDGLLLPGMFVRAVVEEGVNEQAILIPQQAVSRDAKGNPVALVVDRASKVQQRRLTLDRAIGDRWLVTAGLEAGEQVIAEGTQRVRPGAEVKVVPLAAAGAPGAEPAKAVQPAPKAN